MSRYAEKTAVSSEKSRAEIEHTLSRYGADQFMYGWDVDAAVIAFRAHGRMIRFHLPMPDRRDFRHDRRGYVRSQSAQERHYDQAVRQRWRALSLVVKAKLEAVEAGITTFEDEFMAHILLPGGETVGQWMRPQIAEAYELGHMPERLPLLPAGG